MSIVVLTASLKIKVETDITKSDYAEPEAQLAIKKGTILEPHSSYTQFLSKGDALADENFFDAAAIQYRAAIDLNPELPHGYNRLGEARYAQASYTQAEEAYKKAIELQTDEISAHIGLGKTYLRLKQFEAAQNHFNSIEEESSLVLYYRGILAAFHGEYDISKNHLDQVIAKADDPTLNQYTLNYLSAFREEELAQDSHPAFLKTLLGRSFTETGENDLAIALLYDVLRDEEDYRDAWIILGYAYLSEEKFSDARDALFNAIELDPTKPESRYFLGLSYFGLEDYSSAVTQIKLALESGFEPQIQAHQKLGDAAVLAEDYQEAANAYESVLVLNASDIELFIRPIWINLDHLNAPKRALEIANEAIRNHPNHAMSYNLLGWTQLKNNQIQEANESLQLALTLDPNLAAAHFNLGQWHEANEDILAAKESYKKAYDLEPNGAIGGPAADAYNRLMIEFPETEALP